MSRYPEGYSAAADYIDTHGPATRDELGGSKPTSVNAKQHGITAFKPSFATSRNADAPSGHPTVVYYNINDYHPEEVVRKWLDENPRRTDAMDKRALTMAFNNCGKEFGEAWKNLADEYKELSPDDVAECQYCGLTFRKRGLHSHELNCDENPDADESPHLAPTWEGDAERGAVSDPIREADDSTVDEDPDESSGNETTTEPMATRNNTYKNWIALAVLKYWEKHGDNNYAARQRDITFMLRDHMPPESIQSALAALAKQGEVGVIPTEIVDEGTRTHAYLYFPTNVTVDYVRDNGLPTELPDGSPIPDDWELELPTERVDATNPDEVYPIRQHPDQPKSTLSELRKNRPSGGSGRKSPGSGKLQHGDEYAAMLENYSNAKRERTLEESGNPLYETYGTVHATDGDGVSTDEYDTSLDDVELPSDRMADETAEAPEPAEPAEPTDLPGVSSDELLAANLEDIVELAADETAKKAELARILIASMDDNRAGPMIRKAGEVIEDDDLYRDLVTHLSESFNR